MSKKSGLADSPFFSRVPVYNAHAVSVMPDVKQPQIDETKAQQTDFQSSRVTEIETPRVPEKQTSRVADFEGYEVPAYQKMQRIEVRLTWEQNKYLDDLEALIGRDAPEGEKSDPSYRRITKNSILRVMVEILRALEIRVDSSEFKNERDLLISLNRALAEQLSKLQTSRHTE